LVPQPEASSRPRVGWWWDGSDRGEVWAWLLGLAGVVVAFSLGALVTSGSSPIRGIALANLQSGLGVALLPTLVALGRLDRGRLGGAGGPGDREVRRALRRSLATLGLVEEEVVARRRLPPVRPASWYRVLAACWAGFVLLALVAVWVIARELFAGPDPAELAIGFAVVTLPVLLAWLAVGVVALGKAVRVAHWLATTAKAGRTARPPRQPLGRRLAAGPRRAAGATMAAWHGLAVGVAAAARWTASATMAAWHGLAVGVAAAARWTASATVAGWHGIHVGLAAATRWAAAVAVAGWHRLEVGLAAAARWTVAATVAGWHALRVGAPPAARRTADATLARWHGIQFGLAAAARPAAAATLDGWRGLRSGVAARAAGRSGQPLSRRLADDGRRGAGVTLARWRGFEGGSRR
jgi:hypothetical protein